MYLGRGQAQMIFDHPSIWCKVVKCVLVQCLSMREGSRDGVKWTSFCYLLDAIKFSYSCCLFRNV